MKTPFSVLIERTGPDTFYLTTNEFMSDGQFLQGGCTLVDGTNLKSTSGKGACVVTPINVKLGPLSRVRVLGMDVGTTITLGA